MSASPVNAGLLSAAVCSDFFLVSAYCFVLLFVPTFFQDFTLEK